VKRIPSNYDRRKVIVRLTNTGFDLVDDIASTTSTRNVDSSRPEIVQNTRS